MFTRSGSTWTQQGEKLTGGGEIGKGFFGERVALSADGNTALVGAWIRRQACRRCMGVHALGARPGPSSASNSHPAGPWPCPAMAVPHSWARRCS